MDTAARDPELVAFGRKVRAARERTGKRIVDLVPEVDVSYWTLQRVETGRLRASNAVYWRIAKALDLDPTPVLRDAS